MPLFVMSPTHPILPGPGSLRPQEVLRPETGQERVCPRTLPLSEVPWRGPLTQRPAFSLPGRQGRGRCVRRCRRRLFMGETRRDPIFENERDSPAAPPVSCGCEPRQLRTAVQTVLCGSLCCCPNHYWSEHYTLIVEGVLIVCGIVVSLREGC